MVWARGGRGAGTWASDTGLVEGWAKRAGLVGPLHGHLVGLEIAAGGRGNDAVARDVAVTRVHDRALHLIIIRIRVEIDRIRIQSSRLKRFRSRP